MKRIAVIEDNEDNRLVVRALLEDHYEIREYADGLQALAAFPASPPHLVLLDISLPGLDGPEVLQRLRAMPALAAVPVIALTAHAMAGDREKYLAAGFDDYVSKPIVDEELLLGTIRKLLPPG